MTKEKFGSKSNETAQLLGRMVLGGLCGVGLMWTLTALWPPSQSYVRHFGTHLATLSRSQPVVLIGLLVGSVGTLLWQALKK